jgi:hypothetical protein
MEMTHMNRKIAIALLAATVNVAIATASAQTSAKANIPFSFRVGSTPLPAGEYRIEPTRDGAVWIYQVDGNSHAVVLAMTKDGSEAPATLVFNKYGDHYFLHELRKANGKTEMAFSTSSLEKRIRTEEASLPSEGRTLLIAMK